MPTLGGRLSVGKGKVKEIHTELIVDTDGAYPCFMVLQLGSTMGGCDSHSVLSHNLPMYLPQNFQVPILSWIDSA